MSRRKTAPTRSRGGLKWLAGVIFLLLLLPILEVGWVRFFNPPLTPLMLIRQVEARLSGQHATSRSYDWRPLAQMPPEFLRLVLTSEDQRFFQHHGFDWREIRAARARADRTGEAVRGASTISMQCARSLFLWQGRSWVRKGFEVYDTFWMELLLSKRRILELYVNVIEMGDGVYGLEAAARAHYGVSARALTREQCALLVAILPNPRERNPRTPSPLVSARAATLLQQERHTRYPMGELR